MIKSISGEQLTVVGAFPTPETGVTANLAPVAISLVDTSTLAVTAGTQLLAFGDSGGSGTITLLNPNQTWQGYAVGQGVYVQSASDPNGNGAAFNNQSSNPYYVITAINGAVLTVQGNFATESGVSLEVAPVTVTVQDHSKASPVTLGETQVSFGTHTITLASGNWTGYSVGDGIFVGGSDTNANGAAFDLGAARPYYTITGISGVTLTVADTLTVEGSATVNVAPVSILANESTLSVTAGPTAVNIGPVYTGTLAGAPVTQTVNFANVNGAGIITLTGVGASFSGYSVGQGIFVGSVGASSDPNSNGANFDPNNFYIITGVTGLTLTVQGVFAAPETGATVNLAPVNFVTNTAITLANGANWAGYSVGEGIFLGGTGPDANGTSFTPSSANPYYTILSINGDKLVVSGVLAPNTNATFSLLPVTIHIVNAQPLAYVLITETKDVAVSASGTLSASAGSNVFLVSQGDVNLNKVQGGLLPNTVSEVRVRTQGDILTSQSAGAVNVEGTDIVLEAGVGFIGTLAHPVGVQVTAVGGDTGSVILRAQNNIWIDATGDLPVGTIYSRQDDAYLFATGSIYDADYAAVPTSGFAKIQVQGGLTLTANGSIGIGADPLHVNIVSGDLIAKATNNLAVDQTDDALNVLDAYSVDGDVTLDAAGSILNAGYLNDYTNVYSGVNVTPDVTKTYANVWANAITLNAGQTLAGGIGAAGNAFEIQSQHEASGTVSLSGNDQQLYVTQNVGDIALQSVADAGATEALTLAIITTVTGGILNGRTDGQADITSGAVDLVANDNIGSAALPVTSTVTNLDAQSTTGSIWLWNLGALVVGDVPGLNNPYGLYAPDGSITIETSSPLEISQNVLSGLAISKNAGNATDAGDSVKTVNSNLIVDAGVTIQSTGSSVTLDAGDNVTLDGGTSTKDGASATVAGAIIEAATFVLINAGYLFQSTTPEASGTPGEANDTINIEAGVLVQGATVTLNAGNDVNVAAAASANVLAAQIKATTSITIQGGYLYAPSNAGVASANPSTLDLAGVFSAPTLTVNTYSRNSDIEFHPTTLSANTFINAGGGDNFVHLFNLPDLTTYANYVANGGQFVNQISVDGTGGGDTFQVDATVGSNYVININDTGPLAGPLNTLIINGASTFAGQEFLLRDNFVAILESNGSPNYQRINYNGSITNRLEINGGAVTGPLTVNGAPSTNGDSFYIDGNSALTTINAGNGNDFFQVGQVYSGGSVGAGTGFVGAGFLDGLETTTILLGGVDESLSYGNEFATVLYGGAGTDTFEVYSNKADLSMIGGSGNDTFIVRAFLVAAGTHLNVKGGSGDDVIEYNINAPVNIEGGTGFNTLVLLGTEAPDTFVVTENGVYGGGLNVTYTNIQAVTIDTLEGDDTIYVESTPKNVVTTINGGAGADKIIVGGDVTNQVVSLNTQGTSSITDASVTSSDPAYNGIFVAGLQLIVGGSGGAIVSQPPQSIVHVNDPSSQTSFTVSAPSTLATGNVAYVDITPTAPSAEWAALGAVALLVSTDNGVTWAATGQLEFVGGATGPQTVLLRAAPIDPTKPLYTNNETIVVASRVVSKDQPALNALVVPTVKVTLETSATGLIVDTPVAPTIILAGTTAATQTNYTYSLSYNQPLTGNQTVTVNLVDANAANDGVVLTQNGAVVTSVTFTAANWNKAQSITVNSTLSGSHAQIPVTISQTIGGVDVGDVSIEIAATNSAGVLLLTAPGVAEVSSAQPYTYQMVLTQAPTAPVTVNLLGDGQTIASSSSPGFNPANQTYTFTTANWNVPVTITLKPNPAYTPPAMTGTTPQSTILTFPNEPHTVAQIYGPLVIDGGTQPGQPTLVAAVALPYETKNVAVTEPTATTTAGAGGADILQVYADGSSSNLTGSLTTISSGNLFAGVGDNISGIGLPNTNKTLTFTNPTTHVTSQFEGGISFTNLDAVQILLGSGDDNFNIDTTAPTLNADDGDKTLISVEGGGGSNTITVTASSDPLVLYGADSPTGVEYNSAPGAITGNAYQIKSFGTDTINASGATGSVVIVGGPNADTLTGGTSVNWIFGGGGADTITASGATNYIFGDSSATVGAFVKAALQPSGNPTAQTLDLTSRLLTIYNGGATAAANDSITVLGSGASVAIGDYGVVDIVGQAPGVDDPFQSLGAPEVITTIESVNTSLGGNDTITVGNNDVVIGGAGDDHIIVGPVGADVIFGDNGEADYVNGALVSAESLDPLHGGNDLITGPTVNGIQTPVGSGNSVIIGGVGDDMILLGGSNNVAIGDDGKVVFSAPGAIQTITSLDPSYGGVDTITVSGGYNTVLGGDGADQITLGSGNNVVLGDNGNASFTMGALAFITTSDPDLRRRRRHQHQRRRQQRDPRRRRGGHDQRHRRRRQQHDPRRRRAGQVQGRGGRFDGHEHPYLDHDIGALDRRRRHDLRVGRSKHRDRRLRRRQDHARRQQQRRARRQRQRLVHRRRPHLHHVQRPDLRRGRHHHRQRRRRQRDPRRLGSGRDHRQRQWRQHRLRRQWRRHVH